MSWDLDLNSYKVPECVKIIGIAGKARSGKDTVAGMIRNKIPSAVLLRFATPIKDILTILFRSNFHLDELKGELVPGWNKTHREVMQWFGTDLVRNNLSEDFWVKAITHKLQTVEHEMIVVIPDVRFPNEQKFILENNGHIIYLRRPAENCSPGTDFFGFPDHASEQELKAFHSTEGVIPQEFLIINNGTLGELECEIVTALDCFGIRKKRVSGETPFPSGRPDFNT